jgi:hypothetical protein
MIENTINSLRHLCDIIPPLLDKIPEENFSKKPAPEKWSKKEILGHLIDSASNNHQRFVRVQFEEMPRIAYNQNDWNRASRYNQMDKSHLINFWAIYNRHLVEIISRIPRNDLERELEIHEEKPVTLGFVINDYLVHLEHHLHQLVDY